MTVPTGDSALVNVAFPCSARVGEGPVWEGGVLHWVDILGGAIHTGEPDTGAVSTVCVPTLVGAAVPDAEEGFVVACAEGFGTVRDGSLDVRCRILGDGLRMNDAKCDPWGRLWAGSNAMNFDAGAGRLHVLRADWSTEVVLDGLTLPNGLGWSPDGTTFYLVDSYAYEIYAFAVTADGMDIGSRRVIATFDQRQGMPDGMCVDAEGCLWVAIWGGGRIERLAPNGRRLRTVTMPVQQPSSCAFGGTDLEVLYVTSAREGLSLAGSAQDGSVFVLRDPGVRGLPVHGFAG
jgi:sugar lactone lactonase YvrE